MLVVDDDETVRDVVRRYLEVAGFTVELAGDGAEGLRLFAVRPPDLVVLDVMMPGINGLEVCRRLRQVSQVPVVHADRARRGGEPDRRAGTRRRRLRDQAVQPAANWRCGWRRCCAARGCRGRTRPPVELRDGDLRLQTERARRPRSAAANCR